MLIWNFEIFEVTLSWNLFSNVIYELEVVFSLKKLEQFWFAWYTFGIQF